MALVERFLKYVSFDTQSSEETEVTPVLGANGICQISERRIRVFRFGRHNAG